MKILVFFLAVIILSAAAYLGFAFVANEINAFKWHWVGRALFAFSFFCAVTYVTKNLRDAK